MKSVTPVQALVARFVAPQPVKQAQVTTVSSATATWQFAPINISSTLYPILVTANGQTTALINFAYAATGTGTITGAVYDGSQSQVATFSFSASGQSITEYVKLVNGKFFISVTPPGGGTAAVDIIVLSLV